jgi:hypothetical protein
LRLSAVLAASLELAVLFAGCIAPLHAGTANADSDDASLEIVGKYLDATHTQQEVLRGAQMEVDIDATLPGLEKHGKLRALRTISRLGLITYKALGFSGDNTIKQEVITRYLAAESEARDAGTISITPKNYKFRNKGQRWDSGRLVQVFQITPRTKKIGLFKGELWLDVATGMPVRESGRFVKNPSVFLKKVEFVRDYELHDGVSYPKHIESTVDTRIVGRAELDINYSNFSKQDDGADALNAAGNQ